MSLLPLLLMLCVATRVAVAEDDVQRYLLEKDIPPSSVFGPFPVYDVPDIDVPQGYPYKVFSTKCQTTEGPGQATFIIIEQRVWQEKEPGTLPNVQITLRDKSLFWKMRTRPGTVFEGICKAQNTQGKPVELHYRFTVSEPTD